MPAPEEVITVLAVSSAQDETVFFEHLSANTRWDIHQARSSTEAAEILRENDVPVVLCAAQLPDGTWKEVMQSAASFGRRPRLIVLTGTMSDQVWSEVLEGGGYDVLAKPLDAREAVRVVSLAWRQWRDARERAGR